MEYFDRRRGRIRRGRLIVPTGMGDCQAQPGANTSAAGKNRIA
jgi:hypothetical protein